jgi:hypothetical protein
MFYWFLVLRKISAGVVEVESNKCGGVRKDPHITAPGSAPSELQFFAGDNFLLKTGCTGEQLNAWCVPLENAGWSSLVARQAHNLKVEGSNPSPATTFKRGERRVHFFLSGVFGVGYICDNAFSPSHDAAFHPI